MSVWGLRLGFKVEVGIEKYKGVCTFCVLFQQLHHPVDIPLETLQPKGPHKCRIPITEGVNNGSDSIPLRSAYIYLAQVRYLPWDSTDKHSTPSRHTSCWRPERKRWCRREVAPGSLWRGRLPRRTIPLRLARTCTASLPPSLQPSPLLCSSISGLEGEGEGGGSTQGSTLLIITA